MARRNGKRAKALAHLSYADRARVRFNEFTSFLDVAETELTDWPAALTDKELVRLSTQIDRAQDLLDEMIVYKKYVR